MKKKFILNFIIFLAVVNLFLSANIKASEEDYSFNSYSFGFYDSEFELIYVKITVDCDYPEDIPHYYQPNPTYNPGYLEPYEEIWLIGPNFNSLGNIDSGIFFIGIDTPEPGLYQFKVIDNGTDVLFEHDFNVIDKYNVTLGEVKWIADAHSFFPSYHSSVSQEEAKTVGGIRLSLNLENIGDIPYGIGSPNTQELNIEYQMNLYKGDNTVPIYTTKVKNLARPADLFKDQNYRKQNFFKSGETIKCIEKIINDTLKLDKLGSGKYSIDGYVQFRNLTYEFSSKDALIVESAAPGFEISIIIFAIALVFVFKKMFVKL